jgi:hypothetical protein
MRVHIHGPVSRFGARRVLAETVVAYPVPRRSDGSGYETAAAVRAHVAKDGIDTGSAERALIGTDACFRRVGR